MPQNFVAAGSTIGLASSSSSTSATCCLAPLFWSADWVSCCCCFWCFLMGERRELIILGTFCTVNPPRTYRVEWKLTAQMPQVQIHITRAVGSAFILCGSGCCLKADPDPAGFFLCGSGSSCFFMRIRIQVKKSLKNNLMKSFSEVEKTSKKNCSKVKKTLELVKIYFQILIKLQLLPIS